MNSPAPGENEPSPQLQYDLAVAIARLADGEGWYRIELSRYGLGQCIRMPLGSTRQTIWVSPLGYTPVQTVTSRPDGRPGDDREPLPDGSALADISALLIAGDVDRVVAERSMVTADPAYRIWFGTPDVGSKGVLTSV